MQHRTPCRRYLCRAILPAAWGCVAPVPLCAFPLCQLLLPPQPALQHRPAAGAHAAWQTWGRRGEQEVLPLRWGESDEGSGRIGSGRVWRRKRGGSWGSHGGDTVWAASDGRHRAGREGWGKVLAAAVGHGGQRWQGRGAGGWRAPTSHSQGDPLRGDSVDLRGHGAAWGTREGQGGGGQTITIQLSRATGTWEEDDGRKDKKWKKNTERKGNKRWDESLDKKTESKRCVSRWT